MKYRVEYTPQATKELSKLDPHTRRTIKEWIDRHLENCENPRAYGKALTANRKGQWRYRIGDYRWICLIQDQKLTLLALSVGHRRVIYTDP